MNAWRQIRRRCRMCEGEGYLADPHCSMCKKRITADNERWNEKIKVMPCGHSAELYLVETVDCLACWGEGKSWQWVTLTEWRASRRRWRIKLIVVTLAMAFVISFPFVFVWLTPLGSDVCGSWWYFVVLPLLYMKLV